MKNVKLIWQKKSKLMFIPIIGVMLLLSLFIAFGFAQKSAPINNELRKGLTTVAPKDFAPQLVQNKYLGGQARLDEENNIVVSCAQYSEDDVKIPSGQWYFDEILNIFYMELNENSCFSNVEFSGLQQKISVSFNNYSDEFIVLEANVSDVLFNYILDTSRDNTTKVAELKRNDIGKNVIFVDAQINEFAQNGQKAAYYNVANEGWTYYTETQIKELKSYCDNRENKLKLKVELQDTVTGHWLRDYENITAYIPKWVFLRDGKSAFIGNEYGFLMDISIYFDERVGANLYSINSFLLFSLDRQLSGREYSYSVEVLINSDGHAYVEDKGYYYQGKYTEDDYKVIIRDDEFSYSNLLLADPSMSVSLHNLYEVNEFNENYDLEKDKTISISQVRMNYNGYHGKKEKKKLQTAESIYTSIHSMGKKSYDIVDGVLDLATGADIITKLAKAGGAVGKIASTIKLANPYVALAITACELIGEIYNLVDENTTEFKSVSANNENNILTFPAPSQELVKDAVARFGIDIKGLNKKEDLTTIANSFALKDGDPAQFVLGKSAQYAQSIFMLSEVNKPTALTSYLNMAFALDKSGAFNSNVQKFYIPEQFNFAERTTRLFDDGQTHKILAGQDNKVSFFGSNTAQLQLSVAETGYYDLDLGNFYRTAKYKCFDDDKEIKSRDYNSTFISALPDFDGYSLNQLVQLTKNNKIYGSFINNSTIRLFLKAEEDNNIDLKLLDETIKQKDKANLEWFGATFDAKLTRHYDEIEVGNTLKTLEPNQKQYYAFSPQDTGVYKFVADSSNMSFDLYSEDFVSMQLNQSKMEVVLLKGNKYYLGAKNNTESKISGNIKIQKVQQPTSFDYTSNLKFNGKLLSNERIKVYYIDITRAGTYTFVNENKKINVQMKDEQYKECLFGASKAFLKSGKYYIIVRSNEDSNEYENYDITMQFTPQNISIEKDYTISEDSFFTFTAKESGAYKVNVPSNNCRIEIDGFTSNNSNVFNLVKGEKYIVKAIKLIQSIENLTFNIQYYPNSYKTFNETFNDKIVEFKTNITGYYYFAGDSISLFDETLLQLNEGANFKYKLYDEKKYFIINSGAKACEVVLDTEIITVNFELTINAGSNQYLKFVAPENGCYDLKSYYNNGNTNFTVYNYNEISKGITLSRGDNGYELIGGFTYYIKIDAGNTDFVTIKNGNINILAEIPEGTLAEVELNADLNYAASYKFNPIERGNYTFIFNRNLKKDFSILINGQDYAFSEGQNILEITIYLEVGNSYELSFSLLSFGNATLVFGVYKQPSSFEAYVSDRLQTNNGAVNKIAIGEDKNGFVYEQIAVGNIDGRASYNKITYSILNTPYVNGKAGVIIDASGRLTISNALPQWTAFAVEVNIGKYVYGDVVLDEGISKVINFLIYVDISDIKIFDDEENPIYNIDIEHKESMELTAKVFPSHAAQADKLQYFISDTDKQFVSLEVSGNKATITGLYTTPNKKYVKIRASCGDEFTVIIMVRVFAQQIYASSSEDIKQLANGTATAYEIIINGSNLGSELTIPVRVKYLKLKAGSQNAINGFSIKVQSDNLTLVLESLNIYGRQEGLIKADVYNLNLHFVNSVELYGWNGAYPTNSGSSAIASRNLTMSKEGENIVKIFGGNGYNQPASTSQLIGGNGGYAINVTGNVIMNNAKKITVQGGNGGSGSTGANGANVTIYPTQRDQKAENGNSGSIGGAGGNGGIGIICTNYQANNCEDINIKGGRGGDGGKGGDGSQGGNGGKGHDSDGKDAANGQVGGHGGDGSQGGNGGRGAIAINGKIVIKDSKIIIKSGDGGNAGAGGHAANGGRGGDGGDDKAVFGKEGIGGVGGNGGNAGQPGTKGTKGAIISDSLITKIGSSSVTKSPSLDGSTAIEGYKGYGGEGGTQGNPGGYDADVLAKAAYGKDGSGRDSY